MIITMIIITNIGAQKSHLLSNNQNSMVCHNIDRSRLSQIS